MANETKTPNYESLVKAKYPDSRIKYIPSSGIKGYYYWVLIDSIDFNGKVSVIYEYAWEMAYSELKQKNLL